MSAPRKLQQEVDRTMKKIQEGLEDFQAHFIRCEQADINNKEKCEADLKKKIKNLQRLRDTIKGYASNPEIKNKKPFGEVRRSIEVEMEKFKAFEKESKMKAFSTESLTSELKLGSKSLISSLDIPMIDFLNESCDTLRDQIEDMDNEIESLDDESTGKRRNDNSNIIDQLTEWKSQHEEHLRYLESALTRLEKGEIIREQIMDIQDNVIYYLEDYKDPDFMDDLTFYEVLDETAEEVKLRIQARNEDIIETIPESPELSPSPSQEPTITNTNSDASVSDIASSLSSLSISNNNSKTSNTSSQSLPTIKPASSPSSIQTPTVVASPRPVSNKWKTAVPAAQVLSAVNTEETVPVTAPPVVKQTSLLKNPLDPVFPLTSPAYNESIRTYDLEKENYKHAVVSSACQFNVHASLMLVSPIPPAKVGPPSWDWLDNMKKLDYMRSTYSPATSTNQPSILQSMVINPLNYLNIPINFYKFSHDVLLFMTVIHHGKNAQFLAARELKRLGWRYHSGLGTWVLRVNKPTLGDNSETGQFYFMDPVKWNQYKNEFTFTYANLEMDVPSPTPISQFPFHH